MKRRSFLQTTAAMMPALQAATPAPVRLGIDLFSIRSSPFTPFQFLDYAARQGAQVVHFSEIRFLGGLEDEHLKAVRAYAQKLNISLELGMRSFCPSSKAFDPKLGTAEEQLLRMLHAAQVAGSPIVRTFLGTSADRVGPLPIEGHIENAAKVLRNVRSQFIDSGLKIAVENHAGDMQARELKALIETAGKDFVGACLDSGNPLWAIEDPHLTLETLAPYVLTSHVRDTAVWRTPEGAAVAWTRMGDGNIGIDRYVKRYAELCPGRPLSLEIIVTGPRAFPYLQPSFWDGYRNVRAHEFSRFVALAEHGGSARPAPPPVPKEEVAARERADLEASIQFTKQLLT